MSLPKPALLGAAAVLAAALGLITAVHFAGERRLGLESATLLQPPRLLPDFVLTGHDGRSFTRADLQGHWSLLFAGFTHCPDVCPTTLGLLKQVEARLSAQGHALQVLLFSVDPERDTPETLERYVHYFSERFVGVTAPEPELGRVAQALGIAYAKTPGQEPGTYSVDHSSALVLIDPQGNIAAYFLAPHDLATLTADLARVLEGRA